MWGSRIDDISGRILFDLTHQAICAGSIGSGSSARTGDGGRTPGSSGRSDRGDSSGQRSSRTTRTRRPPLFDNPAEPRPCTGLTRVPEEPPDLCCNPWIFHGLRPVCETEFEPGAADRLVRTACRSPHGDPDGDDMPQATGDFDVAPGLRNGICGFAPVLEHSPGRFEAGRRSGLREFAAICCKVM